MIKVMRNGEGQLVINADLKWDKEKGDWVDGLYVSVTNASVYIHFSKEAEEKLKQLLREEKKDEF